MTHSHARCGNGPFIGEDGRVEVAAVFLQSYLQESQHDAQNLRAKSATKRVHVDDAVMEPHGEVASIRAEFDDRCVQLSGGVFGLQNKILHSTASISARFPTAEAAATVPDGEAAVAAVQVEAHDRLQDVLAEKACARNVTQICE